MLKNQVKLIWSIIFLALNLTFSTKSAPLPEANFKLNNDYRVISTSLKIPFIRGICDLFGLTHHVIEVNDGTQKYTLGFYRSFIKQPDLINFQKDALSVVKSPDSYFRKNQ